MRELDTLGEADFTAALSGIYEHSPWIAARSAGRRPFATIDALASALAGTVAQASDAEQDALIQATPTSPAA